MTAPLDLADIARWVSRPGATPAPTAAGPGDPPQMPTGPWHPRHADDPGLTRWAWLNSLDTDEFIAEIERGTAEALAVAARHRALREVA